MPTFIHQHTHIPAESVKNKSEGASLPKGKIQVLSLIKAVGYGVPHFTSLQWGAADAEIKVPSGENLELKGFPFKVWSRSVYSHTCYAYCQEFLPF